MTGGTYPEALMRCGAPHGDQICGHSLVVKLSLSQNAIYMCNRGHRIGEVSDVDDYLMAVVLGALSKPRVRQRFSLVLPGGFKALARRAFAEWWDDASPRERHDLMITAIDRVEVAPSSVLEMEPVPVVTVRWRDTTAGETTPDAA